MADARVSARGSYDGARQLLVAARRQNGATGWWVMTPLRLADGSAVAVVRGWVARADDAAAAPGALPAGPVVVTGLLRPTEPPEDRPPGATSGLPAGQIDRVDGTQLVRLWPWPLLTGYVVLTDQRPASGRAPAAVPPFPEGSGGLALQNVSYALQWFIFAGFGLFLWWRLVREDARSLRRREHPHDDPADALPEPVREHEPTTTTTATTAARGAPQ
jgi:cytochrome oxidase assembly protein ShyY1